MARARGDGGQVVPLVALLVVITAGASLLLVALGRRAIDHASARTAADAAALAGAAAGEPAARAAAAANHATVVSFAASGATVRVVVRVGSMTAAARAERTGGGDGATYSGRDGP